MQSMSLKQQPLYSRSCAENWLTKLTYFTFLNLPVWYDSVCYNKTVSLTVEYKCLIACGTWKPGSHVVFSFSINLNLVRTAIALDDSRKTYVLNRKLC